MASHGRHRSVRETSRLWSIARHSSKSIVIIVHCHSGCCGHSFWIKFKVSGIILINSLIKTVRWLIGSEGVSVSVGTTCVACIHWGRPLSRGIHCGIRRGCWQWHLQYASISENKFCFLIQPHQVSCGKVLQIKIKQRKISLTICF